MLRVRHLSKFDDGMEKTDVVIVELQNKNCCSDSKSSAWIDLYCQWKVNYNNLPGQAGH